MRLPLPPAATLAPSGHLAAVAYGPLLALVDTRTAARTDLSLPGTLQGIAFAPDDQGMALAVGGALSWLPTGASEWPQDRGESLPGDPFRMVTGRSHVAVVARSGERTMSLCGFRISGGALTPVGEGRDLGAVAVHRLHLNEEASDAPLVVLGGVRGRQALSGEGKHFTGLMRLAPDYPLLWKGDDLPFSPHATLYPLAGGTLGITNRTTLVRMDLSHEENPAVVDAQRWPTPLETVALSPNGRRLAWMWAGDGNAMHLQAATPDDPQPQVDVRFAMDGNFPALAVDDEGTVTVVWGSRPDWLHILRAASGEAATQTRIQVPAESD